MPAILPAGKSSLDSAVVKTFIPGAGETQTYSFSGTREEVETFYTAVKGKSKNPLPGRVASVSCNLSANGRGSGDVLYQRTRSMLVDNEEDGIQELIGIDTMLDIKCAPYFDDLTIDQKIICQRSWENREKLSDHDDWNALQKTLYRHLSNGVEVYTVTTYELRISFSTDSETKLKIAAGDINKVVPLPKLNTTMKNLIDSLPAGEWLKKPVTVTSAGKFGWTVQQSYEWALKHSVVYGGTWDGGA